jgi:GDP-L-fucose synthase
LFAAHADLDLISQQQTRNYLRAKRPDVVIMAAGRVGGIMANDSSPANFITENLALSI